MIAEIDADGSGTVDFDGINNNNLYKTNKSSKEFQKKIHSRLNPIRYKIIYNYYYY